MTIEATFPEKVTYPEDADGGRMVRAQQTGQIDCAGNVTGRIAGLEVRIAKPAFDAALHSADGLQCAKRRSLQRDAGAGLGQIGADFGNLAGDTGALERHAECHAGHSGAHNQHVPNGSHEAE